MFKWLNKQGVGSSDGFVLQRMDRYFYHYAEKDHVMRVGVEPLRRLSGEYLEEIYCGLQSRWESPYESESVSSEKLAAIRKNVSAALDFMAVEHRFKV